jgi:hypothetical protein
MLEDGEKVLSRIPDGFFGVGMTVGQRVWVDAIFSPLGLVIVKQSFPVAAFKVSIHKVISNPSPIVRARDHARDMSFMQNMP